MAEANAVYPKFQMRFEFRTAADPWNNDVITSNRAPTASINGASEVKMNSIFIFFLSFLFSFKRGFYTILMILNPNFK